MDTPDGHFLLIILIIASICTKWLLNLVKYQDSVPRNHIYMENLTIQIILCAKNEDNLIFCS